MSQLFGLDIAQIVADSIASAGDVQDVTLIKVTPGTRTPGRLTGGTNPSETTHTARGFRDSLTTLRPGTLVENASAVVYILGATIAGGQVPEPNDRITIGGLTFTIVEGGVSTDPADALYLCQVS